MKSLYSKKTAFTFCLAFALSILIKAQSSSVYFDLDACDAHTSTGQNMNYSEFTGQFDNSSCANISVPGGFIYRNNPAVNKHSCTPGVNGEIAMCISSNPACTFT